MLVDKSVGDDWLSECIARRDDIPNHHFRELVAKASDIVRQRLIANNPQQRALIDKILPPTLGANTTSSAAKDYRTAELVVRAQPLTEAIVNELAQAKKIEEIIVAIAQLSGLPPSEIERLLLGPWSKPGCGYHEGDWLPLGNAAFNLRRAFRG